MSRASAARKASWAPSPRRTGSPGGKPSARRPVSPRNIGRPHSVPRSPPLSVPTTRPFGGKAPPRVPFGKKGYSVPLSRVPLGGLGKIVPAIAAAAAAYQLGQAIWPMLRTGPSVPWGGGYNPGQVYDPIPSSPNVALFPAMPAGWTRNQTYKPVLYDALPFGPYGKYTSYWEWINAADGGVTKWGNESAPSPPASMTPPFWENFGSDWRLTRYIYGNTLAHDPPGDVPNPGGWPANYQWYFRWTIIVPKTVSPTIPTVFPEQPKIVPNPGTAPFPPANWPVETPAPLPAVLPYFNPWPVIPWEAIPTVRPIITEPVPAPNGDPYAPPFPWIVPTPPGIVIPSPAVNPDGTFVPGMIDDPRKRRRERPRPDQKPEPSPLARPRENVKERKARSSSSWLLAAFRIAQKGMRELTEAGDAIDAVYEALPKWLQRYLKKQNGGKNLNPYQKAMAVWSNLDRVDLNDAVVNLVYNQIEDYVIGKGFKSVQDAANRLGIKGSYKLEQPVLEAIEWLMVNTRGLKPI